MSTKIAIACEICRNRIKSTNSKEERLAIKKYCKVCKKHTMHKEEK
ncbi:50S ribosomal protein L33 [Mycoplasmopsis agassizii]|uniref:Large ribosomal subunit protein bL33 n=1 Tax=Mycoplasmopsis agassizii TaxID=33922 RepID=A0A269TI32_9BACT|nr:50S ribosomal protein L33 [Mycoplasmopsis agassizii]PAF54687.1 50S ribosomal protein L33 [Mycoplasmopsis agassizii]PAK21104.1 50S ribosomal protein L33 [Mycoplasmopsis agassizii]